MCLGAYRFNWSLRERLRLESPGWVDAPRVEQMLHALGVGVVSGDIYARLNTGWLPKGIQETGKAS
jgi:hypothetical protein